MITDFKHSILGNTGLKIFRLGLSASYRPGTHTIEKAIDNGVNFFFSYGFDNQMIRVLRDKMKPEREKYILCTGAYNLYVTHSDIRKSLDKRLKQFRTDYIDCFLFLGITKEKHFNLKILDEMSKLREEGKVKAIGVSCHVRKLAGSLAERGLTDVLMVRYNAAHRGAEEEIFPFVNINNTGVISYTATRWTYLIRKQKGWTDKIPDAGMAYRFVLSNNNVDVCLTAPSNEKQFDENLKSLDKGPLDNDEMVLMKRFGDYIHNMKKYFM